MVMLVTAVTERALKSPCDAPDLEEAGGRAVGLSSGALAAPRRHRGARGPLQGTKVSLFARDAFVGIEANLNRGISLLFICGQP